MELERNKVEHRPKRGQLISMGILISLLLGLASTAYIWRFLESQPNKEWVDPYIGKQFPVIYKGELLQEEAWVKDGEIYLTYELFKEKIDRNVFWDESIQSVIITTEDKVIRLPNKQIEGFINDNPFSLRFPVTIKEGHKWIPTSPLMEMYPFNVTYNETSNVVILSNPYEPVQLATGVLNQEEEDFIYIRNDSTNKAPIVAQFKNGEEVEVYGEKNGWYLVQTLDGMIGFVDKQQTVLSGIRVTGKQMKEREKPSWNPLGGKINLTWEHVIKKNPSPKELLPLPGVNVVSPTWFSLMDKEGNLSNKAELSYVKWAHSQGYQVWALFNNRFDPDVTHDVLSDFMKRKRVIQQLIQFSSLYQLDGINIDFENVYLKDKELLVQFVREMAPYLHEQNLTLSIDVTIKSPSENWSLFYDRKRLAEAVDYVVVMTYDEHWASSTKAGSVASLPWVEKGLLGVLEEVPAEKLLLGVPFYTRLWKEESQADGSIKVSQKAISMMAAEKWIKEKRITPQWLEDLGQWYAEYNDPKDQAVYRIWLENEDSMRKRIQLVKKYDLAGIASWRRGFEKPEIWITIEEEMEKRPSNY
ncbi:glycosyl hydrolase family 18 protein [Microaerobacter geothermalis]|uniref:glycosyl hydrolase family 18 protein n=1 Tax=Microaerobacter geothermalis TaxID=674972 RepID=UPI001F2D4A4D|nr:glycosyl hydrolase family 18 protein [Microaerobacter geothermalis]MCF6095326.1 glycosyl hydrolase family 18 protein [Microaerobacter geothermalis]